MDYIYDESGRPFALVYTNGSAAPVTYYYVLNYQGDVVGLVNTSGFFEAKYSYNAWGKLLSVTDKDGIAITDESHIAHLNHLRYRGYYYDAETGFYYLQSRYYDPANCRFINADCITSTGQGFVGTNMFAYCRNNPVHRIDSTGLYDREAAVEYAEKWGESANGYYPDYRGANGDCTNFVSQCLEAGGVKQTLEWACNLDWSIGLWLHLILRYINREYKLWDTTKAWSCAQDRGRFSVLIHQDTEPSPVLQLMV